MGKRTYVIAQEILQYFRENHPDIQEFSSPAIQKVIEKVAGAEKRTIPRYMKFMVEHGFMEQTFPGIYKLNHQKSYEMF